MAVNPWHVRQAVRVLRAGGLIAYPTEAVYGLGCDPYNGAAVMRLLALKRRPLEKGLILIASDFKQLVPFVAPLDDALRRRVFATWPGPATWLWPARRGTPAWLTGAHDSIAVRVTAHPVAAALCAAMHGALVSTSANPSARPPARSALAVQRRFGGRIDYLMPGAVGGLARPTEIRDARTGAIVRRGG